MTNGDHSERTVTDGTDNDNDTDTDNDTDNDLIEGSASPTDIDRIILSGMLPIYGDIHLIRNIIGLFFDLFQAYTGMEHQRIVSVSDFVEKVINRIFWVEDEYGDNAIEYLVDDPEELINFYRFAIIRYLDRFSADGVCNIFHFFSGNIRLVKHHEYMKEWW